MKFRWLLSALVPSIVGIAVLATPVEAGEIQTWRYDRNENRLVFTTTGAVQPTAQLIANPTRLVIDLPGTTLGRATTRQAVGSTIREVRIGQFNAQTARIVIELSPGYTFDPQQIRIQGNSPTQWTVQLPTPQRVATPPAAAQPAPPTASPGAAIASGPSSSGPTQIESVRVTPDGIFVRTRGPEPRIQIDRDRRRRQITVDLPSTTLSPLLTLNQQDQSLERSDVSRVQINQVEGASPPTARITLTLPERAPDWQATVSNLGGIVLVPQQGTGIARGDRPAVRPSRAEEPPAQPASEPTATLATVQAIDLANNGTQLLIRADRPLTYTSEWNRRSAAYEIRIPSARLAQSVSGPELGASSPLLRVRLRQENAETVLVTVQPAAGVSIGTITRPADGILALPLQRATALTPPNSSQVPVTPAPTPAGASGALPAVRSNTRVVVAIDAGHGGRDPGAVGIGGLQEKNIVLPISLQVASLLEQQGLQVILTRSTDVEIDLQPRVDIAERGNANLFVSIHANSISLSRPDVNGLETYYYSASGQQLARVVHDAMMSRLPANDRGVRQARFYVLRRTSMPAILIETGFVTGAEDAPRLGNPAYQSQLANAIAEGILRYVQQNF